MLCPALGLPAMKTLDVEGCGLFAILLCATSAAWHVFLCLCYNFLDS